MDRVKGPTNGLDATRTLSRASMASCVAALLATVGVLLYALPRGLDLTDESLSILFSQSQSPLHLSAIHSQVLFDVGHRLFGWQWSITGLRALRLFMALSGGALLGAAVQQHRGQGRPITGALIGATFGLLQYTGNGHVSGVTYNAIVWFSATALSAGLLSLTPRTPLWTLWTMGTLGFAMWVCKFPAAVGMLGISLLWMGLQRSSNREKGRAAAMLILPPTLLVAIWTSPEHAITPMDFLSVLQQSREGTHDTGNILIHSIVQAGIMFGVLVPAFLAGWFWRNHPNVERLQRLVEWTFSLAFIMVGLVQAMGGVDLKSLHWVAVGSLIAWSLGRHIGTTTFWRAGALLVIPAAITIGTNANWIYPFMAISFFPLLGAWLLGASHRILFASLAVPLLVFSSVVQHPRRQPPLWTCTAPVELPQTGNSLWVHPEVSDYLHRHGAIQAQHPFVTFGSQRFFGELLAGSNPIPPVALWSLEQITPEHVSAWTTVDTLLVAISDPEGRDLLKAKLPHHWLNVGSVSRKPIHDALFVDIWKSEADSVHYYLLTRAPVPACSSTSASDLRD